MKLYNKHRLFIANVAFILIASAVTFQLLSSNEPLKLSFAARMSVVDVDQPALELGSTSLSKGDLSLMVGIIGSFASLSTAVTIIAMKGKV